VKLAERQLSCQCGDVVPTSFGERVRLLREHTPRLAQREVDLLAHLHPGHTWQIEEGHRENPTRQTALALSELFGVSLDWLLAGRGTAPVSDQVLASVNRARRLRQRPQASAEASKCGDGPSILGGAACSARAPRVAASVCAALA